MALMGLLMLFTNLLTCSKCRVISVASTMSIMACRRVRNWFLNVERLREFSTGSVRVLWNMITYDQTYWYLSMFLKMLHLLSRTVSWNARAAWWLSRTAMSLYRMASSLPALHRNELVRPGWSTSWTVAANSAATSSNWSRLPCKHSTGTVGKFNK